MCCDADGLYIGKVGRSLKTASKTISPQSTAYDSGDFVHGGLLEIECATNGSGGTARLAELLVTEKITAGTLKKGALRLVFLSAPPPGQTPGSAFALPTNLDEIQNIIDVSGSNYKDLSSQCSVAQVSMNNGIGNYHLPNGTTLYVVVLTNAALTYDATAQLIFNFRIERD